jgi:prepilin-type N-terminal cleavage/methylation domain-containing protein
VPDESFIGINNNKTLTRPADTLSQRERENIAAFTLAEVLITLAVIGVIAALTMPSLISKMQMISFKNQFKKAYSVYSQNLLKTVMIDFDGDSGCYYSSSGDNVTGCPDFFEQFAKNMNVIKTCKGNALADGCVPVYDYMAAAGCSGFSLNNVNNTNDVYVLSDGSIIIPYKFSNNSGFMPFFMFDVNGMKIPNKVGQDIFALNIYIDARSGAYRLGSGRTITGCLPNTGKDSLFNYLDEILY